MKSYGSSNQTKERSPVSAKYSFGNPEEESDHVTDNFEQLTVLNVSEGYKLGTLRKSQ